MLRADGKWQLLLIQKNKRAAQHFSNVASCVLLKERGFIIGFQSNLEDEIRCNGCVLEVRTPTETHNVRVHCAGRKQNKENRRRPKMARVGSNKVKQAGETRGRNVLAWRQQYCRLQLLPQQTVRNAAFLQNIFSVVTLSPSCLPPPPYGRVQSGWSFPPATRQFITDSPSPRSNPFTNHSRPHLLDLGFSQGRLWRVCPQLPPHHRHTHTYIPHAPHPQP